MKLIQDQSSAYYKMSKTSIAYLSILYHPHPQPPASTAAEEELVLSRTVFPDPSSIFALICICMRTLTIHFFQSSIYYYIIIMDDGR